LRLLPRSLSTKLAGISIADQRAGVRIAALFGDTGLPSVEIGDAVADRGIALLARRAFVASVVVLYPEAVGLGSPSRQE
jgi:hypothetical protein